VRKPHREEFAVDARTNSLECLCLRSLLHQFSAPTMRPQMNPASSRATAVRANWLFLPLPITSLMYLR
jgi:hypothetical protein